MLYKLHVLALLILCCLVIPCHSQAQSAGRQYSLGFYQPVADSLSYHSSLRDYMVQPVFALPEDTARKRSWAHRVIFQQHLLEFKGDDYEFYASFLPDFLVGNSNRNNTTWLNTRGAVAGGKIGNNLTFYTEFYENQGKFPGYQDEYGRATHIVPGQGEWKDYSDGKAFDFAYASALINYKAGRHFNFQLGYDKNFIGDGYRSMLLSDVPFNYPFFKIVANVGRIQYTTMWAQFIDMRYPKASYDNGYRKKWGVFNYLDWNVSRKFSVGLFGGVVWQDSDSLGKRGFDMSYINPIIFLRPVEFSVGSSDNAVMGLNLKYAVSRNSAIYGQFMLDEFKLSEFTKGDGWWGNKFAGQLGFRSNNLFKLLRLNGLTEVNFARPFTYSQRSSLNNYGHYNQPLAHPMGANFIEWVNIADYQYKRWFLRGEVMYARYGLDTTGTNFGKDIFKSYNTRTMDYGNSIGNGLTTNLLYLQGTLAFLLNPKNNLRVEASVIGRRESNDLGRKSDLIFQIGLRSSFRQLYYDF
jgi:hypothetical protein